ncbi:DNA-3-methyladenine glycosylase family protein [Georgenia subflava]|uniref:DNA-3-methyladenine glycosylase 2 family protein n=1 Tax=Georgenia subflava TaxID=1622177 RepID=A0A6N7EIA9_9MICO|nr:DNA-3-methyladenine glycosylase 2 family protein [Georgenia subflava]MPV36355.1 DNA-3-methyladenine glycosylase 2 family protein [Georgenia subflava]
MKAAERTWRPGWPCPVDQVLSVVRKGPGDPTYRRDPDGVLWRGVRTPVGPATLRLESRPTAGEVHATAWGDGADWVLDSVPAMLGADDDPTGFAAERHPVVERLHRRHPHWRVARTGLVMEALVPAIIEQKVTGAEAYLGFRRLVHRFGERAPGAGLERGVWVQPASEVLAQIPSWEWLHLPVTPARSRTLIQAARVAPALERTMTVDHDEADRRLRSLPGIGVWTSAEVRARAHGDADAVSFGDYHVAKDIGWVLTGTPVDDAGLAELLEPFRPHRYRVQRLVVLAGLGRPRRGPRMPVRAHLPA